MTNKKPYAVNASEYPDDVVLRCYNLEEGYAYMVQQDVINKAVEEQS